MFKRILTMIFLTLAITASAQTSISEKELLKKDMYKYYGTKQKDSLFAATTKLKEVCLKEGDEKLFYKTWANELLYTFNNSSRTEGLKGAEAMKEYAQKVNSNYGIYTSIYLSGSFLLSLRQKKLAKQHMETALDYLHKYFPDESPASIYLTMARIGLSEKDMKEAMKYSKKVMDNPKSALHHRTAAMAIYGLAAYDLGDSATFVNTCKERIALEEQNNYHDNFDELVETYLAMQNHDYDKAEDMAKHAKTKSSMHSLLSKIYEKTQDYKKAYYNLKAYKNYLDSANTVELNRRSVEYATDLDLVKAENEAKDLRLKNQQLQIAKVKGELERKQLAEEAMTLQLRNADIELRNAAARQENDSLLTYNQQLQIKQYESDMTAQKEREKTRRTRTYAVLLLAILGGIFFAYLYYRRQKQVKELQEMNARLEEARKEAELALQIKRNFINNISHEIRTPLNSISGFAQILTSSMGDEFSHEERRSICQRINESTDVLTDVIDKMIELSHYDSMVSIEKVDKVDIISLCRKMADEFSGAAAKKGLKINLTTDINDGDEIVTNKSCVEQVFRHLLDNAVKFTTAGSVTIEASDRKDDEKITFSVSDTGPGIPAEKADKVFEPFVDTGEEVKTTGMGLSICRTICKLLGGEILLDQTYKEGCRIVFTLPGKQDEGTK